MYVKVRKIDAKPADSDLTITVSKTALINELREQVHQKWNCEPSTQRLFYKGKQLEDEYRIMDYDIQLNDVIQLMIKPAINDGASTSKASDEKLDDIELIDVESAYYKVGDKVDIQDSIYGAWFEYILTEIKAMRKDVGEGGKVDDKNIQYIGRWELEKEQAPHSATFDFIRPRARYTYKFDELTVGQLVTVNFNIEDPNTRGYWYDMTIDEIIVEGGKSIIGTLQVGNGRVPLRECKIKYVNDIKRIEEPVLLANRVENGAIALRKSQYYCFKCKDVKKKKCKQCGCGICGGKNVPATIILCDECDIGYHLACLTPPLEKIPEEAEWYCPSCKNDENEIVKAGEKLKVSKKKQRMISSQKKSTPGGRDWGKGMACVGRTKECTIVPKDHYGPIPGVDVGTCWKFRVQVSEAGIHRPHVAGIHGRETDGAYSLVLSGGYEDDVDNGIEFLYTGSGGRDLSGNKRKAGQSCDQALTRMNKALAMNCNVKFNRDKGAEATDWQGGNPVRVVRNYKLAKHSKYAPRDGNRYDGLYKVVKYYSEKGKSGFMVWRFLLRRDDPTPAPWEEDGHEMEMIYPAGYLQAQIDNQNASTSREHPATGDKPAKKRKKVLEDKDENPIASSKKPNLVKYDLKADLQKFVAADTANEKLWQECNDILEKGKQEYLAKVQDVFVCICCQEVVYKPVTTQCKHNVCMECLQRSFSSQIFTCPHCRFDLGATYDMKVNENLSQALLNLLPGYDSGRAK